MRYIKKRQTKFVAAVVGMFVMTITAGRQFYLFVVLRNQQGLLDPQGGRLHLWLAGGATLLACLAGGLMFLFFLGDGKKNLSEAPMSPLKPSPALLNINADTNSPAQDHFNAISWAQLNEWCVEGQADDRRPMNGSVGESIGRASAQRSAARLNHQAMYKVWAGERHD